ncbi:uncharacterized protein LOC116378279 [Anarrhichthys ocellatus]|uniref:uncharacterized protein LOC116378279 n=1 Tax=Anarrhichthys ocellatus TaxID=433405 RepID=UPI0012ED4386|nr:uncharacterized protein LOC116378279 [Anarrhichthys ocellatus]
MTVVTYLSAAGRRAIEIQVPEHPMLPGNVAEPLSKILKPGTMPDLSENPMLKSGKVKGQRWLEQRRSEGGAKAERAKTQRQKWGRGVCRERMERGRREERWDLRIKCNKEINKCLKKGGKCMEGKDKSTTDVCGISGILSAAETEGENQQRETRMRERKIWPVFPWPFYLKNVTGREKHMMKRMKWRPLFICLALLLFSLCPSPASSQGHFPRMENIAAFKPVSTSPSRSTCGLPERSGYCRSPSSQTELTTCYQAFCVQECPYRYSTPPYAPLLLPAHRGTCIDEDGNDTRPGTQTETRTTTSSEGVPGGSGSVLFRPVQDGCLVSPPSQALGALGSLTLALWIKPSSPGEMMLLEKSSGQRLIFSVTMSEQMVTLRYGQTPLTVCFRTEGRLTPERWTHLVLQVTILLRGSCPVEHIIVGQYERHVM